MRRKLEEALSRLRTNDLGPPKRLSIAQRLRGFVAGNASVPEQRLLAMPSRAELGRAWSQRVTAQPPDLEEEREFHTTGYSADALTEQQVLGLFKGQVVVLLHAANVVSQREDLPAGSPVVAHIQGRVTVAPPAMFVPQGRKFQVVSVERKAPPKKGGKAPVKGPDAEASTFVQLIEIEA